MDLSWLYCATSFPLSTGMILREAYRLAIGFTHKELMVKKFFELRALVFNTIIL